MPLISSSTRTALGGLGGERGRLATRAISSAGKGGSSVSSAARSLVCGSRSATDEKPLFQSQLLNITPAAISTSSKVSATGGVN